MAQAGQRKCLNCGRLFDPDRRVRDRQRYCSAAVCQAVSKATSARRWLAKPENREYFRGPVHGARVRAWRAAHPGYARGGRRRVALQDPMLWQAVDSVAESGVRTEAPAAPLQDPMGGVSPVLAGLIAHLFQVTLQDEMAATARRLVQLGTDVLGGKRGEPDQTSADAGAAAQCAAAVQLD